MTVSKCNKSYQELAEEYADSWWDYTQPNSDGCINSSEKQ